MTRIQVQEWDGVVSWTDLGTIEVDHVRIRTNDNGLEIGRTISFDLPDGTYDDGTERIMRITMEGASVNHVMGPGHPEFTGFVSIDDLILDGREGLWKGYRKMRWLFV